MTERQAALEANRAFYQAFATGDYATMERLWARGAFAVCIHPGWPVISGRGAVMQSWQAILRSPPPVLCEDAVCHVIGEVAVVICTERIEEVSLSVTNIYANEGGEWRMVHHHAGHNLDALDEPGESDDDEEPGPGMIH